MKRFLVTVIQLSKGADLGRWVKQIPPIITHFISYEEAFDYATYASDAKVEGYKVSVEVIIDRNVELYQRFENSEKAFSNVPQGYFKVLIEQPHGHSVEAYTSISYNNIL